MRSGQIVNLSSYPIKGLSAQNHETVPIVAGNGFPNDREFAFAKADSGFDPSRPRPMPKDRFLVLLEHEKLAGLHTSFDKDHSKLKIQSGSNPAKTYAMDSDNDRARVTAYLTDLLELPESESPFFANAYPHRFTDVSVVSETMMNAISLLNIASVRAFGQAISRDVDPRRFRANIVFDGFPAFWELDLVDEVIRINGMRFRVLKRTQRCAATEVNPDTGERDIAIPYLLRKTYGHFDMGVYIEALDDGALNVGAPITGPANEPH